MSHASLVNDPLDSRILLASATDEDDLETLEVSYEDRAVSLRHVQELLTVQSRIFLPELDADLQICNIIESVVVDYCASTVRVNTGQEHRLYKHDPIFFSTLGAESRSGSRLRNRSTSTFRPQNLDHRTVAKILDPCTFEVDLVSEDLPRFEEGAEIHTPLNMHKLCGEVIIPLTTLEEVIVHLSTQEDADTLLQHLEGGSHCHLASDVVLSSGVLLRAGLTVHGYLSKEGHIRRKYWSMGSNRKQQWLTRRYARWHRVCSSYDCPEGFAEEKLTCREDIHVGKWLVLRKGVSYAEVCNGGRPVHVTDFISHNWSEASKDFLDTMSAAGVVHAWICTLAICQHCIPPLNNENYEQLPFYRALVAVKDYGRVVMALDTQATTLTRIWCVFECWVSYFLGLHFNMFLPSGEVNFWKGNAESSRVSSMIQDLQLKDAQSSMAADKIMITRIIEEHGGMKNVSWEVKSKLSLGAVIFLACLVSNTSNFVFSLPWISNIAHMWFVKTFEKHGTMPVIEKLFVYTIGLCSGVAHLQYWVYFFRGVRARSTLRALWLTLDMGSVFAKTIAALSILELVNVALIGVNLLVHDLNYKKWIHIILCGEKGIGPLLLHTLYTAQKTLPWAAGWIANHLLGYPVQIRDFLPAAPCVGFVITLSCMTLTMWRQYISDSILPFCHGEADLSHLSSSGEPGMVMNLLVCGLSAWAISVFARLIIYMTDVCSNLHCRCKYVFSVSLAALLVSALVFVDLPRYSHLVVQQDWTRLQIGFVIWALGSCLFHRFFLLQWVRIHAQKCKLRWRMHQQQDAQSRLPVPSTTEPSGFGVILSGESQIELPLSRISAASDDA